MSSILNDTKLMIALILIIIATNTYSSNVLCDVMINWIEIPSSTTFNFNDTACNVKVSYSSNLVEKRLIDVSSIFSNPSNYPLNFTINGSPFGDTDTVQFGIVFEINGAGYWGVIETTSNSIQITYHWLSSTSTQYFMYLNKDQVSLLSMGGNTASNILQIGFNVYTQHMNTTDFIIFDYAELNKFTLNPTPNPTQYPSLYPSISPIIWTISPTNYAITMFPTIYPTKTPFKSPTMRATAELKCDEERIGRIISFKYKLSNNDESDIEIKNSLNNAVKQLIENRKSELIDCNISIDDDINIIILKEENDIAIINITICTNCDEQEIGIDFETEFVDKIISYNEGGVDTTFISTTKWISDTNLDKENSSFWTAFGIIICIILICCFIFCIILYFKKKKIDKIDKEESKCDGTTNRMNTNKINLSIVNNDMIKKQNVMSCSEIDGDDEINNTFNHVFGENMNDDDDDTDNTGSSQYNKGSQISSNPKVITPISPVLMAVDDQVIMDNDQLISPGNDRNNDRNNDIIIIEANDDTPDSNVDEIGTDERITGESDDQFNDDKYYNNDNIKKITKNEDKNDVILVKEWLTIKCKLPQYYHILIENGYDSIDIIKEIKEKQKLKEIGILLKEHQLKLLVEIKKLIQFEEDNFMPHYIENVIQYQYEGNQVNIDNNCNDNEDDMVNTPQ